MAYDESLAERVRKIVLTTPGITERKMFGGLAFMLQGHMFIGVQGSTLMARVGPAGHAQALRRPHVREMDFTGHPMKGYVYVESEGCATDAAMADWVKTCCDFAAPLPPKDAK